MLSADEDADAVPRLRDDYMFLTGCALLTGIVLYIAGQLIQAFNFSKGQAWHSRVELIGANVANILIAGVLVAVVIALMHVGQENAARVRPVAVIVVVLAGVVVALSAYLVFDLLTRHISTSDVPDISFGADNSDSFSMRLASVLPVVGTFVVAAVALIGAYRLGDIAGVISGNRETSDDPQEIPEVE